MRSLRYQKEWGKKKSMFKGETKGEEDKRLIILQLSLYQEKMKHFPKLKAVLHIYFVGPNKSRRHPYVEGSL